VSDAQKLAERVVNGMMAKDAFSQWLGIEVLEIAPRRSTLRLTVRAEMINGFGVTHGGIVYSLADSALAFACNSKGTIWMAVENTVGYAKPVGTGDVLTAVATEDSAGNKLGFYRVVITNQRDEVVSTFRGTVYNTGREHSV
jgi:acyl-CoA thioesterase